MAGGCPTNLELVEGPKLAQAPDRRRKEPLIESAGASELAQSHNIQSTNRSTATLTARVIKTNFFIFFMSVPTREPHG
jgi:hypothetical protein